MTTSAPRVRRSLILAAEVFFQKKTRKEFKKNKKKEKQQKQFKTHTSGRTQVSVIPRGPAMSAKDMPVFPAVASTNFVKP